MTTLSAWILILSVTLPDGQATTTVEAFGSQPDCAAAAIEAVADVMQSAAQVTVSCKTEESVTEADLIPPRRQNSPSPQGAGLNEIGPEPGADPGQSGYEHNL